MDRQTHRPRPPTIQIAQLSVFCQNFDFITTFLHFDHFDCCDGFEDMVEWIRNEMENTMTTLSENFETVAPSDADALLARESSRRLATHKLGRRSSIRIQLLDDGDEAESVAVPASALRLFLQLLTEMSQGNAVTLIPTHAELTTQQAADLLNVSRPYLVKLLDEAKIPCRTVGKYRRVRFDDLMAYKRKDDEARAKVLDQLTAEAQELGMGY
jgi:excisionase family DNA binding protein